jgi:hypothetical protein
LFAGVASGEVILFEQTREPQEQLAVVVARLAEMMQTGRHLAFEDRASAGLGALASHSVISIS